MVEHGNNSVARRFVPTVGEAGGAAKGLIGEYHGRRSASGGRGCAA